MTPPDATPSGSTGAPFPFYQTSFVGRESEVAALLRALESNRLVTVIGPGGIGKTRFAVESARAWVDANASDALFADLSGASAETLQSTILRNVSGAGGVDGSLVDYLSQGSDLLVLDNCEHVAAEVAEIVTQVLRGCPGVHLLATSRAPLGVSGEARFPLGPLPTGGTAEDLFTERARLADATLELGDEDRELVSAVCAGLDGMPLGIELAAASLRSLALSDLVARLPHSLDSFESPLRDAPARQRNLRAAIQWSYDLLGKGERLLFPRLAVFSGGWQLDSAEDVCSGEGVERREVLRLLRTLVDHGLVVFDAPARRYRFLEPVRQFAEERCPGQHFHQRHAEYFAGFAEELGVAIRRNAFQNQIGLDLRDRERLGAEAQNLRVATRWSVESGNLLPGLRIVAAGASGWKLAGLRELPELTWSLVNHPAARTYGDTWALAQIAAASMEITGDEAGEGKAVQALREAFAMLSEGPERTTGALALGRRLAWLGETDEASQLLLDVLEGARFSEDPALECTVQFALSQVAQHSRDWEAFREHTDEALRLAQMLGERWRQGRIYGLLGDGLSQQGLAAESEAALRRAAALQPTLPGEREDTSFTAMLARALLMQGRFGEAAEMLRTTIVNGLAIGDMYHVTAAVGMLGVALGLSGAAESGVRLLAASSHEVERVGLKMFPGERDQFGLGIRLVQDRTDPAQFASWYAAGEAMTILEAAELALNYAPEEAPAAVATRHPAGLTAREVEVLRLLATGNTNRQIAAELVLSLRTVETHIFNVYNKTDTGGRAAATGWAIANGIYEPPT